MNNNQSIKNGKARFIIGTLTLSLPFVVGVVEGELAAQGLDAKLLGLEELISLNLDNLNYIPQLPGGVTGAVLGLNRRSGLSHSEQMVSNSFKTDSLFKGKFLAVGAAGGLAAAYITRYLGFALSYGFTSLVKLY